MDINQLIRSVRSMVNNNDHGGAYQVIAEAIGNDGLSQAFAEINRRHLQIGRLPFELYEARHMLYQQLMATARKHLGEDSFQRLRSAL